MFVVLIPVGPGERDLERLDHTVAWLRRAEAAKDCFLVVIDDAPQPRSLLDRLDWPSAHVLRTGVWRKGAPDAYSAMIAGTLDGLRFAATLRPEFVLKLDVDALTIGPFAASLRAAFVADETLGVVGSYDVTCVGTARDWSVWHRPLSRIGARFVFSRATRLRIPRPRWRSGRARRRATELLAAAQSNGYVLGAHCLGGAYAVSPSMLRRADLFDWRPWVGTGLGEDIVLGVLAHAAGLRLRGLVGKGEPFGLAHEGLPAPPERLVADGHSIVHSVKHASPQVERSIRDEFARLIEARTLAAGASPNTLPSR